MVATVGRGFARATPDAARVSLEVWAELDTPDAAIDEVARRSAALAEVFDELDIPTGARTTSDVSLTERWDHRRDEAVFRGYRAGAQIQVRVVDLRVVGRLVSRAAQRAQARPQGTAWEVDAANPARSEACRLAAEDARRKAEAYATALELRLGPVVSIREPGARRPIGARMMASGAGPMQPMEGSPDLSVEAGDVDITATVEVVFRLETG